MEIAYRKATAEDAELLIGIYNAAFYRDYQRYGECPGYGKTKEMMTKSIADSPKFVILCDEKPVGAISCRKIADKQYEVGSLCIIPEFQGMGIGTKAFNFALSYYDDWEKFTLITPVDKEENVKFYTQRCLFTIDSVEMDGHVKVFRFVREREGRLTGEDGIQ